MSMNRLSAQQKKKRRKRILVTLVVVAVVAAAAAAGLVLLRRNITEKYARTEEKEILTATVTTGSIRTTVSGSGSLAYEESEEVILPAGVIIDRLEANFRSQVEEGELLATVNTESVVTAMAEVQAQLDELDKELSEAEEEEVDDEINTPVSGRVKKVFAGAEEDVTAVMYEHGALALLSLDGYMTLDIQRAEESSEEAEEAEKMASRDPMASEEAEEEESPEEAEARAAAEAAMESLRAGDSVTITDSYGDVFTGTVDSVTDDRIRILASDKKAVYGDEATVTVDGVVIGTGEFDIHEPLAITGYAGAIAGIYVNRGDWVDAGDTLFTLMNTSYTARYESLLKERAELEEQLRTLIEIYNEGGLYAPIAGTVDTVNYDTRRAEDQDEDQTVMTIRPSDRIVLTVYVDELDVLSLEEGQEATVTVSSIDGESFRATVTEIDTEGTGSGGVTQFAVTMTMDYTSSMRAGMSASAAIAIAGSESALILPEDAVQQSRDTYYVYTAVDEETGDPAGAASVEIGVTGNGNMEILSGLQEGDTVYYTAREESFSFPGFGSMEMGGGFW